MNIQATLEKLSGLRLSGMEHAYRAIIETRHPESLTADELVAYLVDAEWDDRQERKTTRLMKTAAFRARATFPEVDFAAGRSLDKNEFLRLSDCSWVTKGRTIIISGPTGAGKSFLAQALGTQRTEYVLDVLHGHGRQAFRGFVHQQDARPGHQRATDGQHLALASR